MRTDSAAILRSAFSDSIRLGTLEAFLSGLVADELQRVHYDFELWARAVGGKSSHFDAGQTIFEAGEQGIHAYVVRSGSVDIVINGRVVESVGPNGIFGELALLDGGNDGAAQAG